MLSIDWMMTQSIEALTVKNNSFLYKGTYMCFSWNNKYKNLIERIFVKLLREKRAQTLWLSEQLFFNKKTVLGALLLNWSYCKLWYSIRAKCSTLFLIHCIICLVKLLCIVCILDTRTEGYKLQRVVIVTGYLHKFFAYWLYTYCRFQ